MYSSTLSLTLALYGVGGQRHATPLPFYSREWSGTHCTGGWVGPNVGLKGCGKFRPHWVSIPRPFSP